MRDEGKTMQEKKNWGSLLWSAADRILWILDTLIYVAMIGVVLLQIMARLFLPKVPSWTEELSRYLQIYLVAFGAGLAVKYDSFVSVETIFNLIGKRAGLILKMVNHMVVSVMFVFFAVSSLKLYELGKPRTAVTMPSITMNMIYFSMIFMSISVLCYLVKKEIFLFRELKEGGR